MHSSSLYIFLYSSCSNLITINYINELKQVKKTYIQSVFWLYRVGIEISFVLLMFSIWLIAAAGQVCTHAADPHGGQAHHLPRLPLRALRHRS